MRRRLSAVLRNRFASVTNRLLSADALVYATAPWVVTRERLRRCDRWTAIGRPEQVDIGPPMTAEALPEELLEKVGSHYIPAPFVVELADIELVGPDAVAVLADDRYVLEESLGSIPHLIRGVLKSVRSGTLPRHGSDAADQTIDCGISLAGPWSTGYYHWFSDYLLRLQGVQHYIHETGRDPTLIIPANPPEWMEDSLELAGFGHLETIEWTQDRLHIDTYILSSLRRETQLTKPPVGYVFSPQAYRWLGERIADSVNTGNTCRKVFISRANARERHVVNETMLMNLLRPRGFRRYVLEDMSFRNQVKLFAGADVVVAPNGAGLTNMIYATDLDVVVLFGSYVNACYPNLADTLGFSCGIVRCAARGLDMWANPAKVTRALDRF